MHASKPTCTGSELQRGRGKDWTMKPSQKNDFPLPVLQRGVFLEPHIGHLTVKCHTFPTLPVLYLCGIGQRRPTRIISVLSCFILLISLCRDSTAAPLAPQTETWALTWDQPTNMPVMSAYAPGTNQAYQILG